MSELKILICDDDPDLLGLLTRRLDKMGVKPDVANDGRQALALVEQHNYDVIVTDIYMPEATGLEVMQHAKQLDQDTQVVIITSSATLDNAIDALNHGAFGYLTKPFDHLIVFDNMVSRAIEYRHLLVAEKRKAEAQKRRGDMLEDEVAQRVQQLQKKQKGLLDLLGSLPDGILVVEEGGKVVLSSPVGERWLARDEQSQQRPIHAFLAQVHAEMAEPSAQVKLGDRELQLMSAEFPNDGEIKRKAVIIRELEDSGVGAGSMVTDTVMGIKKGLATLYEQGLGTEIVLNLANQFAVLEQLSGWSSGTAKLKPAQSTAAPPPPSAVPPAQPTEAAKQPAPPTEAAAPATPQPSEAAAPPAIEADPQPTVVSPTPPFLEQRERVSTAELGEPRMNTAELQDVLRSVADEPQADQPTPAPQPPAEQSPPAPPVVEPAPEIERAPPAPEAAELAPDMELEPAASPASPADETLVARPKESAPSAAEPAPPEPTATTAPQPEQPAETAAEPAIDLAQAAADSATNGTGELAAAEPADEFPAADASTGELDSAIFRPRVIPEQMDAKLETPVELPNINGKRGLLARAKGPLKIQSSQADTQVFRKVLAGLSGSEVESMSGEKERPPEVKPRPKPEAVPQPAKAQPEPARQLADETPEPVAQPEPEPEPDVVAQPTPAKAASWPPKRPSEDPDWDDDLDVSG